MITISSAKNLESKARLGMSFRMTSDRGDLDEEVFFLVPRKYGELLSGNNEGIIPLAALLALLRGEDAHFEDYKVDPLLARNVRSAISQLSQWFPEFTVPRFEGLSVEDGVRWKQAEGASAFLSGGVDSLFSLVRHTCGNSRQPESALDRDLSHAMHIYHTPFQEVEKEDSTLEALADLAQARGVEFFPVFTNMMTFDRQLNDRWGDLGHGGGLSTVLHLLSGKFNTGLIASSHTFGGLMPWGSSPLVDPLWSGNRMRITHDGSTYSRVEKTELIAKFPDMLAGLNVCDNRIDSVGYINCSKCQKCLRTMVTLDLCSGGDMSEHTAFDWSEYDPSKVGTIFLRNSSEKSFIKEIREFAIGKRPDIVRACDKALAKSKNFRFVSLAEEQIKKTNFGRQNRAALISLKNQIYRSAGWALKD